ncbi:hypothetical protein BX666DRAFT_2029834 [Dichotomocladium elegans]|nr:hypothetical protein BX666DRAFT_2029834 [Dichotomocladium elegans]
MRKPEQEKNSSFIAPMPATDQERIAALRNLGATFFEGQRQISKIATPTGDEHIPTFLDTTRTLATENITIEPPRRHCRGL